MRKTKVSNRFSFDWPLIIIPLVLSAFSLATLYSITAISGRVDLVMTQGLYFLIAFAAYFLFAAIDYRVLKPLSKYLFILGIILLLLVEILGKTVFGSSRWIDLGFFQLQPSELMKFFYIIMAASYFSTRDKFNVKAILFFIALTLIPAFLILREPDLGTTLVIIATLIGILIASRPPAKFYYAAIALVLILSPIGWKMLKPYQKQRVTSFMNPEKDPMASGYNVVQSKIAVGSGGLTGKGFTGATQSQLSFLPVVHIDFIFSALAEATGFLGSVTIVFIYCLLIYRIFSIANLSRDAFGQYYAVALGSLFSFQIFVNIGMNIGLAPVTGIPLPLLSYGGTSLIVVSAMLGVAQSIYMRSRGLRFD